RPRLPQTGGERESERRRGWNRRTLQSIRPCSRPPRPAIASASCLRSPVVGERLERVLLTSGTGVTESQNEETRRPPPMTVRPRRSVLYMPGANARALEKAKTLPCDAVILDLEDAVAPSAKVTAREQVMVAVKDGGFGAREVIVRINGLD